MLPIKRHLVAFNHNSKIISLHRLLSSKSTSANELITLCATNVRSESDVFRYECMTRSWKSQTTVQPIMHASVFISNDKYGDRMMELSEISDVDSDSHCINLYMKAKSFARFEHFLHMYKIIRQEYSSGGKGSSLMSIWVLFSDINGIWNTSRSLLYDTMIKKIGNSGDNGNLCSSVVIPAGLVIPTISEKNTPNDNITVESAADVDNELNLGSLEKISDPMQLWSHCVRLPVLGAFLTAASPSLLAHRKCEQSFLKFLTFHDNNKGEFLAPSGTSWHYFQNNDEITVTSSTDVLNKLPQDTDNLLAKLAELAKPVTPVVTATQIEAVLDQIENYCALFPPESDGTIRTSEAVTFVLHHVFPKTNPKSSQNQWESTLSAFIHSAVTEAVKHESVSILIRSPRLSTYSAEDMAKGVLPTITF